jgi:hypothetical protein
MTFQTYYDRCRCSQGQGQTPVGLLPLVPGNFLARNALCDRNMPFEFPSQLHGARTRVLDGKDQAPNQMTCEDLEYAIAGKRYMITTLSKPIGS